MTRHIIQITSSNIIHLSEEQTVQCFTWLEILPQLGDLFDYIFSSSLIKLNFLEDFQHGCTLYMYSPVEVIVSPSRSIWGSLLLFFFLPWYMQLLLDKIISYVFFFFPCREIFLQDNNMKRIIMKDIWILQSMPSPTNTRFLPAHTYIFLCKRDELNFFWNACY